MRAKEAWKIGRESADRSIFTVGVMRSAAARVVSWIGVHRQTTRGIKSPSVLMILTDVMKPTSTAREHATASSRRLNEVLLANRNHSDRAINESSVPATRNTFIVAWSRSGQVWIAIMAASQRSRITLTTRGKRRFFSWAGGVARLVSLIVQVAFSCHYDLMLFPQS
ncbi:MAG: hypothetical protein VB855_05915 [Pirellulaceae bacterium]